MFYDRGSIVITYILFILQVRKRGRRKSLGVLDIYGFEIFEVRMHMLNHQTNFSDLFQCENIEIGFTYVDFCFVLTCRLTDAIEHSTW